LSSAMNGDRPEAEIRSTRENLINLQNLCQHNSWITQKINLTFFSVLYKYTLHFSLTVVNPRYTLIVIKCAALQWVKRQRGRQRGSHASVTSLVSSHPILQEAWFSIDNRLNIMEMKQQREIDPNGFIC
jgi:hypothetical protein